MGSATSIIKLSLQSNQYEQGLRGAKKQFEDFAASIGINMKKLTAYGLAAGAAASAINSMTSAISTAMTEGTRMAKEMEGVRMAFNRLNQPGLLDNLREATHGTVNDLELMKQAVKFDNFNLSLDQMGNMLAFAQQQAKDTGQDVGYLVDSIVTGLGRKSLPILDNLGLSATDIKNRMKETGDMTKAVADIIQERMEAAGGYVETAADRAAKATADMENAMIKLGETFGPITQNSDSLWNSIKVGAINALNYVGDLINYLHEAGRISKIVGNMNGGGMMERFGNNLRNSKDPSSLYQRQLAEINRSINSAEAKLQQAEKGGMGSIQIYRERVQALKEIKKQYQELYQTISMPPKSVITEPITTKTPKGGGSSKRKGFDISSIALDPNKAMLAAVKGTGSIEDGYSVAWKLITEGAKESTSSVNDLVAAFEKLNDVQGVTAKDANKDSGNLADNWRNAGTAIGAVGAAMSQIEDPAAKVMGTIAQAIATIALTFASSLKGTFTPWDWIAAAAAGTATMISTIAAIHSATGYAEGGMIKGNSYSGDNIGGLVDGSQLVGLNAGEVVLNAAQQNTLAQNLQGNGSTVNVVGRVVGEDIFLSADRYARRSGRGSILTGKNL